MLNQIRRIRAGLTWLGLKCIGHIPSHTIRKLLYRLAGMQIGQRSYIYSGAEIRNPKGIRIGNDVIVGHNAILDGRCGLTIEDNVNLSTGVWIWTMQHDHNCPDFSAVGGPVTVGTYAWLSARCIILPNLQIGPGCVIAAGAVVTKSTSDYHLYGGVPAKIIGVRSRELRYRLGDAPATPFI